MIKNLLASIAAAGVLVSPIVAQAGTRAADAGVSMAGLSRTAAPMGAAEQQADEDGIPMWLLILLFAGAGAGIIAAVESGENTKSQGT